MRNIFLDTCKIKRSIKGSKTSKDYFQTKTSNLLSILSDFLSNRKRRILPNGQTSSLAIIAAGVPQVSILFLIYINDLPEWLYFYC